MIQRFSNGAALFACAGLMLALAGCGGDNAGATGTSGGTSGAATGDSVATIGSAQVTRADMGRFLEAQYGEQVLPYLIDTRLLFEEAKAKNITVSDADVEADLKRRGANDPSIAQLTATPGARVDAVREQIRRDIVVQRLLTAGATLNDAQVQSFFTKNRAYYDTPGQYKIGLLISSTKARADIMSRALKAKTKTFDQLVAEQKKVNDPIATQSSAGAATFQLLETVLPTQIFGPAVIEQVRKLPKGGVTNPVALGGPGRPPVYAIFRVTDLQPGKKADLATLRPVVEVDAKMAQIAEVEVKKNPANPPFAQTLTRTREFLQGQNPASAPGLRDVLTYILRPSADNLLSGLRTNGSVQIADASYTRLATQYQPVPTAAPGVAPAPGGGAPGGGAPDGGAPSGASPATPPTGAAPAGGASAPQ